MSLSQRRALVDPALKVSIRHQCQWLNLPRSSYYYQPYSAPSDDLLLIRLLDEQYLLTPQCGYRKMTTFLREKGHFVNHKRVQRLLPMMGMEAIYRHRPPCQAEYIATRYRSQVLPLFTERA